MRAKTTRRQLKQTHTYTLRNKSKSTIFNKQKEKKMGQTLGNLKPSVGKNALK